MPPPTQSTRRRVGRAAQRAAALALAPLAGACSSITVDAGGWLALSALLLLVALAAFALGLLAARQRYTRDLRVARGESRCAEQLLGGWHWETDAEHRLLRWGAPGQTARADCVFFGASGCAPALDVQLRTRLAFAALQVRAPAALDGSVGWQLSGVPRQDDHGRFAGFVGRAQPTDGSDAMQATAAALVPALAAQAQPCLFAIDGGAGWHVQHLNSAAQARWPGLVRGQALADWLAGQPEALGQACRLAGAGSTQPVQGWQLALLGPTPGGVRGLLLTQQGGAGALPGAESDSFSFTVSHDLRAPIRVVDGFTRIVKEDYGRLLDRVGNEHLDRVLAAAARMNLMIDALLTLARLSAQPLAHQPVDLSQLAAYVADELRRGAPTREAVIEIEPGLRSQGDPTLLRLVLENLLGNAWKYSARAARAEISLRRVAHGDGHAYVVRDNGAGFDMRSAERLFGLFQRLHSASDFPGHGVGLASVRRIVQRHGGTIWAEAEAGRGAAFYFTLAA
jgi:signal transduction histidine kinase